MHLILAVVFVLLSSIGYALAADIGAETHCGIRGEGAVATVECGVRLTKPGAIRQASITINDNELNDVLVQSFDDIGGKSAWFFLIDRSNPARKATVKRSIALVKQLYSQSSPRNLMGVGTFAEDLRVMISPGDPYADFDSRFAAVSADGAATAFFFTGIKAIDILKKVPADRRALVMISDGKAEDTAYSRGDLVKHAKDAGVVIYGIGIAEKRSDTIHLQEIERLAAETGGHFVSAVGNDELPPEFLDNLTRYLTSGGGVKAPIGELNGELAISLRLALTDGTEIEAKQHRAYVAPPPEEPAPEPVTLVEAPPSPDAFIVSIYSNFDGLIEGSSAWARDHQELAWLALILPLMLLGGVLVFLLLRREQVEPEFVSSEDVLSSDDPEPSVTTVVRPESASGLTGQVFGYFDFMEQGGRRFEIREQNVTIGRHTENDLQLDDDSVHRHHAVFHLLPGHAPVLTDLDTLNGVSVNGERIRRAELRDGDVIKLGETSFRFVAA